MADHEIIDTTADALPPVATGVTKMGIAIEDAIFKRLDDAQNRFNNLLTTAQQIHDIVKQINNPATSADNQFVATAKALAEANAQGHGLAADLQANSALQAAAREHDDFEIGLTAQQHDSQFNAKQKATREVADRRDELQHAQEILSSYDVIASQKQADDAAAQKDEGIILEHEDLQQRIAEAKDQANADAKTHDLNTAALGRDWSLVSDLDQDADAENSSYQAAKQRLPGEENKRAQADKVWSDLEGAKNQVTQLQYALAAAQQRLSEVTISQTAGQALTNPSQITDTGSAIQNLQQSVQTYHETILEKLNQFNATVQHLTVEVQNLQYQHSNHGP